MKIRDSFLGKGWQLVFRFQMTRSGWGKGFIAFETLKTRF
jgi:hypothetical protein